MAIKKKINKQGIIVISIAVIASIVLIIFLFSNPISDTNAIDTVNLGEGNEASYMNLSVPNSNQKEDSLSLIDKIEKIKIDSINNSKLNSTGLDEYDRNNYRKQKNSNNESDNFSKNNFNPQPVAYSSQKSVYNSKSKRNINSYDEPLEKEESSNIKDKVIITNDNDDSGFFKKKSKPKIIDNSDLNIYASVHTNQTIMNNQRVKFRSTKEFYYKGQKYPINTIIYGLAEIKPNRLIIKINKINQTDIKLEVYDSEDSEQGMYVITPNLNASLKKELKKEGIEDDDLRNIPFSRSLKNIFEKTVKEEKVQLLNNYKVIIKICKDE